MNDKPRTPAALATRCRRCRKPIVWPGLCYTCATGLPRLITRADEREPIEIEIGLEIEPEEAQGFPLEEAPLAAPSPAAPAVS